MSMLIKHETSQSQQESFQQPFKLESMLHKLAMKTLRSVQNMFNEQLTLTLQKKYEELVSKDQNIVEFLQFLIYSLLNQVDRMQQSAHLDIVHQDYQVLEEAVQKSEAEIRKHIRIQQQLKIYLDSLEEKTQQLEQKLEIEEQKYSKLFECMKEIEEQRKELMKKVTRLEEGRVSKLDTREKSKSNSNYSTINDQLYKDYLGARKTKLNKGKHIIDKLNERARKLSEKQTNGNGNFVESAIEINLSNNAIVNKKNSYDNHLTKHHPSSHDSSFKELTKTVQMKQPSASAIDRRPNRKVSKYKTETAEHIEKKECRSNSVCN